MEHSRPPSQVRRQGRLLVALLKRFRWNRETAAARARELAAEALEAAALEVRAGQSRDDRTRALVGRALRRLGLVADLESGVVRLGSTWMVRREEDG